VSIAPIESFDSPSPAVQARRELRARLRKARDQFIESDAAHTAQAALAGHLKGVLAELLPQQLGLYWPLRSEFNAVLACLADKMLAPRSLALPYACRLPREMHYRAWDRREPTLRDECGILSAAGPAVVPDVVLVPCVGFTASGYRLGYGGGYYDRWLAAHPHATAVGVAWSVCEASEDQLAPQAHDVPLMLVVTERGVAA